MKMIKPMVLALCCCFLFSFNAQAQAQNAIGGRVGVNLANWGGDDDLFDGFEPKRITGIHAALAFQIGISFTLGFMQPF